jgi:hypothetical protein
MAYRDNWLRHLLAPLTGEGFSNALARDFASGNLWDPAERISWRWLKLVWAYSVSVVAQFCFAVALAAIVVNMVKGVSWETFVLWCGGGTAAMLVFAVLVATATYIDVIRRGKNGSKSA